MASNVINITVNQIVKGDGNIVKATNNLNALGTAVERVQNSLNANLASNFFSEIGGMSMAITNLQTMLGGLSEGLMSFDSAMRSANTMAGKTGADFDALKDKVSDLAKTIPLAREELANGLYQVISNGVPEDNWIEYLNASARSAVGGIADVGEVVKVTSTIIKNYGMEWSDAQLIQDKIQLTAKNGVTSFEQLAAALPSVTGQAAQLGVSLDEMLGVMSTLTGVTGNTSEVSTQLSSVLTALTKESSKAQKMAAEMGIEFNAASVRAAGGLQNFLYDLDNTVTAYANKTGELRESIYSKLFGRAEALRLVNALTGEMSAKFGENVGQLKDSLGTMDEAFEQVAGSAESKAQLLKNSWTGLTDAIGAAAAAVKPYLSGVVMAGQSVTGVIALSRAFISVKNAAHAAWLASLKLRGIGPILSAVSLRAITSANSIRGIATALNISTRAARALAIAMRMTGIGLIIGAIAAAVTLLTGKLSEAKEEADEVKDSMAEMKKSLDETFNDAAANATVEIETQAKKLKELMDAHKDTTGAVNDLNKKYGDTFGYMRTAAEWYDTLIKKSRVYAQAIGYEAMARDLGMKHAQKSVEIDQNRERRRELQLQSENLQVAGKWKKKHSNVRGGELTEEAAAIVAEMRSLDDALEVNKRELEGIEHEIERVDRLQSNLTATIKVNPTSPTVDPPKNPKKNKDEEIPPLDDIITAAYHNLEEYDKAIDNLRKLKVKASAAEVENIQYWIDELQAERDAFGKAAKKPLTVSDIEQRQLNTIKDYSTAISDLNTLKETASRDEIAQINEVIDKLTEQRNALENLGREDAKVTLDSVKGTLDKLQVLDDYDKAINDLRSLRGQANAEELAEINKIIDALETKRELLDVKPAKREAKRERTNRYDGTDAMGKIEGSWSNIKGMASTVDQFNTALDENASAWKRVAAAVDGCIGVYKGIADIIDLCNTLSSVTQAASAVQVATSEANAEAAYTDATAQMADASAKALNAHSWIPFVGVALGLAAVAAMVGAIAELPKYAEGGIAYGPTVGIFGEYPGASHNPEVVAPLDRLRSLLVTDDSGMSGKVKFEIEGRALRGVLERENNHRRRN